MRALFAILVIVVSMASPVIAADEAPLVTSIEINGLRRIGESAVRAKMSQLEGAPLDEEAVSSDIKAIFSMGHFDDVRVEVEPYEGGLKLVYVIKERPSVMRIDIVGNDKVEEDKLREKMTLSPGAFYDVVLVKQNADIITSVYSEKGYTLAKVVPVVRKTDDDRVYLTYQITEGPKVKIREIKVEGNEKVSTDDIDDVMKTSEWWLLSPLTSGGRYEEEKFKNDVDGIKALYLDRGYLDANVSEPEISFSEDRKWMDILINVTEGKPSTIATLSFSGNKVFGDDELRAKALSAAGETISRRKIRHDVEVITEMYRDKGYALVYVFPNVEPTEGVNRVKVVYVIDEGAVYRIGRVEIRGNIKTRDKVIRRELSLNEGDVYNNYKLRRSYEKINNLGVFETVNLTPRPNPDTKTIDLLIEVKERPTGYLNVGGGYSSRDKLIGMVDITQGNLGGRGQYVKLSAELGGISSRYELTFRDPWFFDYPVSFSTSIYKTDREYSDYSKKADGFSFGFGKRFLDFWRTGFSYNLEKATIYDIKDTASSFVKEQEGASTTSSVSPSVTRDSRDNYLDPHRGSKNSLYLTYAGIGGDNKFFTSVIDSGWYFPAGPLTFSLRGRYGYASGLWGKPLPVYERYYVGGINTVRGLGFGEAGPRDEDGHVIGGDKELIFNTELIFPLIPEIRLKGVAFFDAGTAYEDEIDMRYTAGLGIRWISPVGPLRLEWGYNLDRREDEKQSRWEFTFGTFF